jgi:phage terminase large subunit
MKAWFIDHVVNYVEYPDYNPDEFESIFSTLDDNKYVNREEYTKRLKNLPDHLKRAYLFGEWIIEGAYFVDFKKAKHCINSMPTLQDQPIEKISWINVYRSIDWGYFPDPAVCHWHVVLPNKQKITFNERTWTRTLAADVANEIKLASAGMHIVESFCDPTMFIKTGNSPYSIAEIFEQNGVPLTASQNDRELFGYSIHEMLNTIVEEKPSWQILEYACPELVRTLPLLQMDKSDAKKVADGPDHWAISCAYFAMGKAVPSRDPVAAPTQRWRQPKRRHRNIGSC